jgi:AhpD family alkylhydroperoxidase
MTRTLLCWRLSASAFIILGSLLCVSPALSQEQVKAVAPASLTALEQQARHRVKAQARAPLADESAEVFKGVESFDPPEAGRVPNYLRALAQMPGVVKPFAKAAKTFIYGGTVAPEVKVAMGLRIAQLYHSPYVATHTRRLLRASGRGEALLGAIKAGTLDQLRPAELLALRYAELLTREVQGVSDAEFQQVRGSYNDAQIVELTMTVSFFNYFTRLCEGLQLPVEAWALETKADPSGVGAYRPTAARVGLISDAEITAVAAVAAAAKDAAAQTGGLGLGIANSQRAMMRVPDITTAWRAYTTTARQNAKVGRDIQLQVSFAVSMANGCRYCTLHQVLGLRRLGVEPAQLVAMRKSDEALTARERLAVDFARKLTRAPASVTDADYATLRAEFQEQGALEVLLQTCNFAFMNRFTDGLRLPSEDEAIRVYREVYGSDWPEG